MTKSSDLDTIRLAYRQYDNDSLRQAHWRPEHPFNHWATEERAAIIRRYLEDRGYWPVKGLRVLDVGCGYGHWLDYLVHQAGLEEENAFGIDLLPERVKTTQSKLPQSSITCASAHEIPFGDQSFDIVFCFTLLSSLPMNLWHKTTEELKRVLKPNGMIAVYDFRYPNPQNSHTHAITKKTLRSMFSDCVMQSNTTTLLPPLGYRLFQRSTNSRLVRIVSQVPVLRSHRLTFIRPFQRQVEAKRIFWLWAQGDTEINRPSYQRLKHFSAKNRVCFLLRGGQSAAPELLRQVELSRSPFFKNRYVSHLFYHIWALGLLITKIAQRQVDWIYTFPDFGVIHGFWGKRLGGCRWIADMIDDPALELQTMTEKRPRLKYTLYWLYVQLLKRILKHADVIPAIGWDKSGGLPETLQQQYGVRPVRIVPVANGIDLANAKGEPVYHNSDEFSVLYLGGLAAVRGLETLIRATACLQGTIPNLRVHLVGQERHARDLAILQDEIAAHQVESIVRIHGKVRHDQALNWMASADVCVVVLNPSIKNFQYTYSVKLFEYLALNKAVVAPDLPGVRAVITEGFNGLLYTPGDDQSLAEVLARFYHESNLRPWLESNARRSIEHFDWALIQERMEREMMKVLGETESGCDGER